MDDAVLLKDLAMVAKNSADRKSALQTAADLIRTRGPYRWVGLYDVDHAAGEIRNIVFSGPNPPEYPVFSILKGLTATVVAEHNIVNVGNVSADSRYLTALQSSNSEIIVPIFTERGQDVVGTIDIESADFNAFDLETEQFLRDCALALQPLWVN